MANRFWVGGTGTWDASSTTHWSATSGGSAGASVPGSADAVFLNGSSGGGTVTVAADVSITSLDFTAFTGTLDFGVNNNNVAISGAFSGSGTSSRSIKLGNGTWTFTSTSLTTIWNMGTTTNLTFDAGSSVLDFTGVGATAGQRVFQGGGLTYAAVRFRGQANGASMLIQGSNTFAALTVDGPNAIVLAVTPQTITTLSLNGSASSPILLQSSADTAAKTISVASNAPTMNYVALRAITGSGGASFVANNSFDLGGNTGITINGPSGGGHVASRQRLGM